VSTRKTGHLPVEWCLPNPKGGYYKRPFTYTTTADSDLIVYLAESGRTWSEVALSIHFAPEAKAVSDHFVAAGYGDVLASQHVSTAEGIQ